MPQCGSVRFIVPVHSPVVIFGRNRLFNASSPWASNASVAPLVKAGYIVNARFAASAYSLIATLRKCGSPCPP